jgi:hypothetical protein
MDFIEHFAEKSYQLYSLLKGKVEKKDLIIWTSTAEAAFQELKQAVVDAPMLHTLQPEGKITLYTDASEYALGGHLTQEVNGKERSVSFVSKVFSDVQKRWAVCEKEMYALYYCIKKLHYLIGGRKFFVRSDHKNLQYWTSPSASPKIERWKIFLSEYDYSLDYIRGEDNLIADALSRVDTVVRDGNSDIMFPQVIQLSPNAVNVLISQPSARVGSEHDGEIELVHDMAVGHFGLNETLRRLKGRGISWAGMRSDVESYIRTCHVCQQLRKDGT